MKKTALLRMLRVWGALLVLLALTTGTAFLPLGPWNSLLNLAIAAVKTLLVAVWFMRLRGALLCLVAVVPLVMLAVLGGLSLTDYGARAMQPAPWQGMSGADAQVPARPVQ